ncbi:MAG: DNA mismatch repair protein MutS, partial [Planctomycetota bacterium]
GEPPPVVRRVQQSTGCAITARPDWTFRISDAAKVLREHFGVARLEGFGFDDDEPAVAAAGALLRYFLETQIGEPGGSGRRLGHLQPPRRHVPADWVSIDAASLRSLEVERTMRSGQVEGSLLSVLQHCVTAMGKRLLRQWLCFPANELAVIESRQQAVAALLDDHDLRPALATELESIQDVARIVGRLCLGRATPRDLVALGMSVDRLDQLEELLAGRPSFALHGQRLAELGAKLGPLARTIRSRCVDAPPAHLREGGLFRDGFDAELDEARSIQRDANEWLARYQKSLSEQSGIPSLKVGYNKVFGYYIEITHAHREKVPAAFSRKQTLKNAERYITPELKEFEEKVTTADSRAVQREQELFDVLCDDAATHRDALRDYADTVAELDVLSCFAHVAHQHGYVRPTIVEEPVLQIVQGRHPVLDRMLRERFVPNDCRLGLVDAENDPSAPRSLAIITGPNMAGKSTYIRQVALITLMAHAGSYVPADAATIGLTDRIFTRIGASDELHTGQSTFMVEMTETANILHHATPRSLVILDEIGRGTSTLDGLSLAWAIAESIATRRCRTLFATHYHELTGLADRLEQVTNLHVSVREWGEEIVFLYQILPGRTDRRYGIHVAKIAGLPRDTIDRASELLETLAVQTEATTPEVPDATAGSDRQMGLFTEYLTHPAVEELRELDLDSLTPLDAFDVLRRLRERTRSPEQP